MKRSIIILFHLLFLGCDNEEAEQRLVLPSNLQINVTVSDEGTGRVDVLAKADKANFYTIFFEDDPSVGIKSNDGKASYTFAKAGIFRVLVHAHTTESQFIAESKIFSVTLDTDVEIPSDGATSPLTYPGKTLVWQDEFDGNALNAANWSHEIGTGVNGWGNNELQFYREENTEVRDGNLIITAKKEPFQGSNYTSSRIVTSGKRSFAFGRIDIRAVLPQGQGIWPALWMLGANFPTVGWPSCGEIDIMEMVGGQGREKTVLGTAHWDNNGTRASFTGNKSLTSGTLADQYHVYSIEWTTTSIIWYLDNVQFHIIDITPAELNEFQKEFYFIFNVAVGGNLPGNPDATSTYPQRMMVDYVRVFQ